MNQQTDQNSCELNKKLDALNKAKRITLIGPLCTKLTPSSQILPDEMWVFIDGGARFYPQFIAKNHNSFSFLIVGDGDSLLKNASVSKESFDILLPREKDQSDLEYFLNLEMSCVEQLTLIGFSGEEIDHELSNIGALFSFLDEIISSNKSIDISVDDKMFFKKSSAINHYRSSCQFTGGFSLFTLKAQSVSLEGHVRYQGNFTLSPFSSRGISNFAEGEIQITHQNPILLIKNQRKG